MTITTVIILIVCGAVVNIISALLGIGGGVLMVPILRSLFPELPIQVVAACSLTIVMGTATINLMLFQRQYIQISKKNILLWSLGMMVGVQVGFELSFLFSDNMIIAIFIFTLLTLSYKTLFLKPKPNKFRLYAYKETICNIAGCGLGGLIAGITGIGGGSIMAPLVAQIRSVTPKQVAVYTNYMMVIGGIGNLYGYLSRPFALIDSPLSTWQTGYVNFAIVGIVVVSSLCTVYFSMKLRNLISAELTTKLLGIVLFSIACYMGILQFFFMG
ncbi:MULTISPECIES: sulfite exporter TauE/SafE family protein [Mannheimia]|uniref:sulfite exporter TauE/SafE family protein n=1 Tax=Mannheimia TaxID=75984 RepID=UPI001318E2F2|nr:sulfite exporter TauE/SafE family protein [Mannheimia pernigra]QHB17943.1 TSUP family transporter [Mannheimia pernigra]